jgi:uncharacterized protein (TIGR02271 family)
MLDETPTQWHSQGFKPSPDVKPRSIAEAVLAHDAKCSIAVPAQTREERAAQDSVSEDTVGHRLCTRSAGRVSCDTRVELIDRDCGVRSQGKQTTRRYDVTEYGAREERSDRFTGLEDRFAGYEVYDQNSEKIGKVDDLFVDESDQPEYIGIKMGFLGMSSTLIPWQLATVDEASGRIDVSVDKETAKNGPAFDDDREITPEYENEIYSYYGLQPAQGSEERGAHAASYSDEHPGVAMGDTDSGTFREHDPAEEGVAESGSDLEDEDELRVQRTEEELRAGTRERQAGALNVRKRVRTDRERIEVPTRHEEVSVERVPVEGEATEAEIGDDEVSIPVTEEEVVVEKRPVAKEEVRIRKDVVEDTEVVEEDVRREEVDVDDVTERRQ